MEKFLLFAVEQSIDVSNFPRFLEMCHQKVNCAIPIATENCSKNRAGGFNQLSVPNKVVHQYEDVDAGERCHVRVLDKYFQKLPPNASDLNVFYLRPVAKKPVDSRPWFISVAVGKNPLSKMLKTMCWHPRQQDESLVESIRGNRASSMPGSLKR